MKPNSFYPVLCTDNIQRAQNFYTDYFGFETTFEADWYISLKSAANPAYELAVLDYRHESVPDTFGKPVQGLLLNLEVDDVDQAYQDLKEKGLKMALDIRSEEWGQRHFIVEGPDRVLVDVIQVIQPSDAFAADYKE